jgi:hypothetical protein
MHAVNLKSYGETATFTHQDTSVDRIAINTKQWHVLRVKMKITYLLSKFPTVVFVLSSSVPIHDHHQL